jgi:hypothetical protein
MAFFLAVLHVAGTIGGLAFLAVAAILAVHAQLERRRHQRRRSLFTGDR